MNRRQDPTGPSAGPSPSHGPHGTNVATYAKYSRAGADRFDLPKLLQPYIQRIWMILLLVLMGGVAAAFKAFRMPDTYSSRSTLHVAKQQSRVLTIEGIAQQERNDDVVMLNTIAQSISNSTILRRVISSNRFHVDRRFVPAGETSISEDAALGRVASMIKVRLRPNTLLIDVSAVATNAELSALVANATAREFIAERAARTLRSTESGSDTLVAEIARLEEKLKSSERRLLAFREKNRITSIESERQSLEQRTTKLTADLTTVQDELANVAISRRLVNEAKGSTGDLLAIAGISVVPAVASINQQLLQQHLLLAGYTNRYRPKHPKFITALQQLADLERAQREAIAGAVLTLEKRLPVVQASEAALKQELAKVESRVLELNRISAEYSAIEREVATDTALQQSVLKRIKELELSKQVDNVPISIAELAPVPTAPSGPNRPRLIVAGALAGLLAGMAIAYVLQSIDGSIRTVDEAEERLQLPVLGAVSIDASSKDQSIPRLVMVDEAHGLTAEGFRSLRAATAMIGRAETIKMRLITSALPSEGKSFCALNYAAALAQLGQRVALIDLDLRRPTVGKRLAIPDETPGVSSFLLGHKNVDEIELKTRVPGLSVFVAGPRIPNPAEQLASPHTRELFDELSARFDVVVMDTAPINSVADTISLLPFANIVLLVVRAGKTPERAVQRAISEMKRVGTKIDGLVLNQLPKQGGFGYYYYYYSKDGYKASGVYGAPGANGNHSSAEKPASQGPVNKS